MTNIEYSDYIRPVSDIINQNIYGDASVPSILASWSRNKFDLYKRFGDKTIINTDEISLEIDDEIEIRRSFRDFKNKSLEFIGSAETNNALIDFLDYGVTEQGFKENLIKSDWTSADNDRRYNRGFDYRLDKPTMSITKGGKFSKSLKTFFDLRGDDSEKQGQMLKDLQSLYSTYRQNFSAKKKGKLFLSIDPYDYLTISDNNHNWSSCHSMIDGEYRIGNLNYMADGVTAVGYYASDDLCAETLDAFGDIRTWNSKRWRVLIHMQVIDGRLTVAYNKQYPFTSDKLMGEMDNLLMSICGDTEPSTFVSYDDARVNRNELMIRGYDTCQYTDFRVGNQCFIRMSDSVLFTKESIDSLTIGEPVLCLTCGNHITTRAETGQCDYCSEEFYCEDCDGYYNEEDMVYLPEEDRYVCYSCYDQMNTICESCGETYHANDMSYIEALGKNLCQGCVGEISEKDATLILVLNDAGNQLRYNKMTKEELLKMYVEINTELIALRQQCKEEEDDSIVLTAHVKKYIKSIDERVFGEEARFQNQLFCHSFNIFYKESIYNLNPLKSLPRLIEPFNDLTKIFILGSTNEESLDTQIEEIRSMLASANMENTMLDYSRVRIV